MNINLSISAIRLINGAQHKSASASKELATLSIQDNSADITEFNPTDKIKSILNLKVAEQEVSLAVKLLETDQTTLGALLDIKA